MFPHCNKVPLRFNSIYLPSFNSIYLAFPLGPASSLAFWFLSTSFYRVPSASALNPRMLPSRWLCFLSEFYPSSPVLGTERKQHPLARIQDSPMELPGPFGFISRSMAPGGAMQLNRVQSLSEIRVHFPSIRSLFPVFFETRGLRAFI